MNQREVHTGCWGHLGMCEKHDKDKPVRSASDVLACISPVSATLQAFFDWFQASQIYLRARMPHIID